MVSQGTKSCAEARYKKYKSLSPFKVVNPQLLPPTSDALFLHSKRANFASYIAKQSLKSAPHLPSPLHNGWNSSGKGLEITRLTEDPIPSQIANTIYCKYSSKAKACATKSCSCVKNNIKCSDFCACQDLNVCRNAIETDDCEEMDMLMESITE